MTAILPHPTTDRPRLSSVAVRLPSSWLTWRSIIVALAAVDIASVLAAFVLAHLARFQASLPLLRDAPSKPDFYVSVAAWAMPIWIASFAVCRLYKPQTLFADFDEYNRVAVACTVGTLAIIIISFFYDLESIARAWLMFVWAFSIGLVWTGRFIFRRIVWGLRSQGHLRRRAIVVGTNEEGHVLAEQLLGSPFSGIQVVGFVDRGPTIGPRESDGPPILGAIGDLDQLVKTYRVKTSLSRRPPWPVRNCWTSIRCSGTTIRSNCGSRLACSRFSQRASRCRTSAAFR